MIADFVVECLSVDVASSGNDDVLAHIEVAVEFLDLVRSDGIDHVTNAVRWLTEEVISEGSVVD